MGSPITPLCHIGFLGLGSWAPLTQSIRCCVRGVGSLVALGRQPRPCTQEAPVSCGREGLRGIARDWVTAGFYRFGFVGMFISWAGARPNLWQPRSLGRAECTVRPP